MRSLFAGLCLALLAGCASTTKPGAVGVTRPQLVAPATSGLDKQVALAYSQAVVKLSGAGRLNRDPVMTARVRTVAQRLIAQTPVFRSEAVSWQWEVNVLETEEVNAFCAPGGKIMVYTGLITRLNLDDDELAAVLGHEISHALREHTREQASQKLMANALISGIANSGTKYAGVGSAATAIGSHLFVMLPYSREMESESDVMGMELAARAGYDPAKAISLQRKMADAEKSWGRSDFFKTHPAGETRIAALQAALPLVQPIALAKATGSDKPSGAPSPVLVASAAPSGATRMPALPSMNVQMPIANAAPARQETHFGKDSFQVERLAKTDTCNASPVGDLVEKGAGFEKYRVACTDGTTLGYRCEFGQCRKEAT